MPMSLARYLMLLGQNDDLHDIHANAPKKLMDAMGLSQDDQKALLSDDASKIQQRVNTVAESHAIIVKPDDPGGGDDPVHGFGSASIVHLQKLINPEATP